MINDMLYIANTQVEDVHYLQREWEDVHYHQGETWQSCLKNRNLKYFTKLLSYLYSDSWSSM